MAAWRHHPCSCSATHAAGPCHSTVLRRGGQRQRCIVRSPHTPTSLAVSWALITCPPSAQSSRRRSPAAGRWRGLEAGRQARAAGPALGFNAGGQLIEQTSPEQVTRWFPNSGIVATCCYLWHTCRVRRASMPSTPRAGCGPAKPLYTPCRAMWASISGYRWRERTLTWPPPS